MMGVSGGSKFVTEFKVHLAVILKQPDDDDSDDDDNDDNDNTSDALRCLSKFAELKNIALFKMKVDFSKINLTLARETFKL